MEISKNDTALVVIDPQNDVLSETGVSWALVGASVGCVDRSAETAQATMREITAGGGKAEAIACDVTSEAEVAAAVGNELAIDILINNAGIHRRAPLESMPLEAWQAVARD